LLLGNKLLKKGKQGSREVGEKPPDKDAPEKYNFLQAIQLTTLCFQRLCENLDGDFATGTNCQSIE